MNRKPSYLNFDLKSYPWKPDVDYRKHPEEYKVGKGEQGVLICEPYKTEIGMNWRFKNQQVARLSATTIFGQFSEYIKIEDFVGADMARKYLQMGYTRARRYANYKSGKKYDHNNDYSHMERGTGEAEKALAAAIFYDFWKRAEANELYKQMKKKWKKEKG